MVPAPASVFVDPTQLEQVILNLAVNARDAMGDGGTFTLNTSVVDVAEDFIEDYVTLSSGYHVLIKVTDTGIGMDEETLGRVFDPFFTTKGPDKGTGLGLATAYGIVKQNSGVLRPVGPFVVKEVEDPAEGLFVHAYAGVVC